MNASFDYRRWFITGCSLLSFASLAFAQFSGVRSKVEHVGPKRPIRPPHCEVAFFNESKPERTYDVVAHIDVYVRRNKITQGRQTIYEEAVPELRKRGCQVGADAIIVLRQSVSSSGEFKLLYVKAEAIRYPDGGPK